MSQGPVERIAFRERGLSVVSAAPRVGVDAMRRKFVAKLTAEICVTTRLITAVGCPLVERLPAFVIKALWVGMAVQGIPLGEDFPCSCEHWVHR